ncbi:MAG: hemerythrin domain-containing protein [Phycisphaeraceae bacterium]
MPQFKHAPIQRHPALTPLSRDHYTGLVCAQRSIRAADAHAVDRREALGIFLDAWFREIDEHIRDEERLLIELMNPGDRDRLLTEHARLRRLADEARAERRQTDPDADWLRRLGETLRDHIRWEERELFPRIEDDASEEQLAVIRHETDAIEDARPRSADRNS